MRLRGRCRLAVTLVLALVVAPASPAFAAMSRTTIMARAQQWVSRPIPYSQTGWADLQGNIVGSPQLGWRRDCSGFASMCWGLQKPGATTRTWQYYGQRITKPALQPGDALISYNNHAVIFGGWADPAHQTYYAYEMSYSASKNSTPTPDGTVARVTPYPYWGNDTTYLPYRLPGVTGNIDYTAFIAEVYGANRYDTAVAASRAAFPEGGVTTVVLASGENWPDALGAAALAGVVEGPVLLTPATRLPDVVAAEIRRLGAREIVVCGGEGSVSPAVVSSLRALGTVVRIGGRDRYDTSRLLAVEARDRARAAGLELDGTVFVATGTTFPDALAASPIAYALRRPILLTPTDRLSADAEAALRSLEATACVVLGGTGSVAETVEQRLGELLGPEGVRRIAGPDRYSTARLVALAGREEWGLTFAGAAVAAGANFPDALAGGAMAGRLRTVLLLTPADRLDDGVADVLLANAAEVGMPRCLGGPATVGTIVRESMALMVAPPPQPPPQ